MANWYSKIQQDITHIPDFIAYYESELEDARREIGIHGIVEKISNNFLLLQSSVLINYKK